MMVHIISIILLRLLFSSSSSSFFLSFFLVSVVPRFKGREEDMAAMQKQLEDALVAYVASLPREIKRRKSSVTEFTDPRGQEDTTLQSDPAYIKYQKTLLAAKKGQPTPPQQPGDIVFGLEALNAPRWDDRDVILDVSTPKGTLLDKLGLISLPRIQVTCLIDGLEQDEA